MTGNLSTVSIQLTTRGAVPRQAATYAMRRIEHALATVPERVLHASVVIAQENNPAQERPARIEVALDVNGTPVRAHVAASTPQEAADLVVDRLQRRLVQLRERTRTRHRWISQGPTPAEPRRRHGDLPAGPPVPTGDRQVVRRKTFVLEPLTPDEAAYEMDLLDHDFYLFTDASSGVDAVVYHRPDGGFGILGGSSTPVPCLSAAQAKERLRTGGERFVFYRDAEHSRGRVLYLRRDGRYGVLAAS